MQLACGLFHLHKGPNTVLVEGHSGVEGWGLSKSRERRECIIWQSPTFFCAPQPPPKLPVNRHSGNSKQHILSSNTDVKVT